MPAVAPAAGIPSRLGKYELLMPLAAGGMARIYIGRSTGIGSFERHVVLKMIAPERANDQTTVNMFLDEARLAASLNHQNVAQVFEVGEETGIHYLAMEYVHGQDMRAVLAKAGSAGTRIPLELALTVVAGAAAGLNHAHERRGPDGTPLGIVHRDVSPSNIMIGYDGAVKLLDFGIAKAAQRSVVTQSGIIKGKFAYMSPEQCRGREVDRRSDVFSLGIILYEVTTQHRCFRADSDFDTMHRIVTGDVVRPTRLVQGYPQALEAIVMKALAIDPAQRYQSAGLLLEALESFAMASRMPLSTMGLGRFMRDMFGDVQEPWLNASMKMEVPQLPRESTISSTNGAASAPSRNASPTEPNPLFQSSRAKTVPSDVDMDDIDGGGLEAAKTVLRMPGSLDADPLLDDTTGALPGGRASPVAGLAPWAPMPAPASTSLGVAPVNAPLTPSVPASAFPYQATPHSGTGPPLPAMPHGSGIIASTKHGYASAAPSRADTSYPRYQPPLDAYAPVPEPRANRRPLYIGLGVVIAGVIVMVAVSVGGHKEPESPTLPAPVASAPVAPTPSAPAEPAPAGSVSDENMVSVIIESDPPGADVLIAGSKIGTTPFNKRVKRGTKVVQLTVRKDGYAEFTGKVDLRGEYENKNIKLVAVEAAGSAVEPTVPATPPPSPTPEPSPTPPPPTPAPKSTTTRSTSTKSSSTPKSTGSAKKQPKCQPPGPNVDPFGLPVCKS